MNATATTFGGRYGQGGHASVAFGADGLVNARAARNASGVAHLPPVSWDDDRPPRGHT